MDNRLIFLYYPFCWSRGTEKARLAENRSSVQGRKVSLLFQGVRRGRENAPSQCSSTRRYGAEVTHAILPGKARTTLNKRVPVPETDTGG